MSLNFKPIWESTAQIIASHCETMTEELWNVWYEIFKTVNCQAALPKEKDAKIDFANFRNQLLLIVPQNTKFCQLTEKHNALICHEFLEVFHRCETKTTKGEGLLAYLKVFAKFTNLQSMSKFEAVKNQAQNGLGSFQGKVREVALGFFCSCYKDLRPHKVINFKESLVHT